MNHTECAARFPDDASISDETPLLRRIPPWHFRNDPNVHGGMRPSSAAFEDDRDGEPMSVYRQDVIELEGGAYTRVLAGHAGFALVSLGAHQVRERQQTVHPQPLPGESAHAVVCGPKTDSVRRYWAKSAKWVVWPGA